MRQGKRKPRRPASADAGTIPPYPRCGPGQNAHWRTRFMDKKIAGLLGTVAAVGAIGTAQAAPAPEPSDVLKVNCYAELLEPIPNAAKVLQAIDEQAPARTADARVQ